MNILGTKIRARREASRKAKRTRRSIVVAAAGGVVLSSGVAYAFWTATGTGSGTAKAATFQALTIGGGSAPSGQLYPGLSANGSTAGGDITVLISNPNPFPVTITSVAPGTGALTVTGSTPVGGEGQTAADTACASNSGVSIITKSSPSVTYSNGSNIPAKTNNVAVTISKVVSMSTQSVSECQGATFTFAATGVSLGLTSA